MSLLEVFAALRAYSDALRAERRAASPEETQRLRQITETTRLAYQNLLQARLLDARPRVGEPRDGPSRRSDERAE